MAGSDSATGLTARGKEPWQADIQVRLLEVIQSGTRLTVRVVVYADKDAAIDSRVLILLPVGSGVAGLPSGCAASPHAASGAAGRATVHCRVGTIPVRGLREVTIGTTIPRDGMPKRFGVFTYSDTPDPVPANNYAERTIR
jgi:hypothetical protein